VNENENLKATSAALTARFRAAGINAEPGLGGSVVIYASDLEATQILALLTDDSNPEDPLAGAVAAALNTATSLWMSAPVNSTRDSDARVHAELIAVMMGDNSDASVEAVLAAITTRDTGEDPLAQAARDALMPFACGTCGTEVDAPGQEPDHFEWCPRHPDAVADAKRILFNRILARVPDPAGRASAESMLEDLLTLAEASLDEGMRDALVGEILAGRRTPEEGTRDYEVAGATRVVTASSPEEAVARATREWDEEAGDKYAVEDPNPQYVVRPVRDRGSWQRIYLHEIPELPPDDAEGEH
jgi:hypothetical protein